MTKAYEFNWQRPVPEELLNGALFDVWDEVSSGASCTPLVDAIKVFTGKGGNRP